MMNWCHISMISHRMISTFQISRLIIQLKVWTINIAWSNQLTTSVYFIWISAVGTVISQNFCLNSLWFWCHSSDWNRNMEYRFFSKTILKGYSFYVDLPAHGNYGGVGIFVKSIITCTFLSDLKWMIPNPPVHKNKVHKKWIKFIKNIVHKNILEDVWLEVIKNDEKYIIRGLYRHPNTGVKLFTEIMERRLDMLHKTKKQCILVGDLNIDLCKFNVDSLTENYLTLLQPSYFDQRLQPGGCCNPLLHPLDIGLPDQIFLWNKSWVCFRSQGIQWW